MTWTLKTEAIKILEFEAHELCKLEVESSEILITQALQLCGVEDYEIVGMGSG